ncbi:hypothetical protein B9Z19DRAFT_1194722 [Tuber borchii]|uniref:DUF6536 domain-containing protein n=1 Tax=Tuber borchii TaxID=42251 RepID=A0A2T6ZLU5_TUBBO|nr:hypothetical protein B9Z19DRAFT_1194722 [Tuber borchii]
MLDFRKMLPEWSAGLVRDSSGDRGGRKRGGGNNPSSIELSTPDSESIREQPNSPPPVWKPIWLTGWHTGVLACATSVIVVLFINVSLTIYAATNPEYKMERGIGTLYSGSCDKSRTIGLWLHLGINALSTLLLSGSNYTQQCLAAPTRSEIDAAHARRRWMDIGVPSIRNLFKIKVERTFLWIAIGITSIPLHLLYNSAVYTSLSANEFFVIMVTRNHFEPGTYTNTSSLKLHELQEASRNATTGKEYGDIGYQTDSHDIQLLNSMLEGQNTGAQSYDDLTPSQCTTLYNKDFVSSHRNLFLISNYTEDVTHENALLRIDFVNHDEISPSRWMCSDSPQKSYRCNPNELTSRVASGHPWLVAPMIMAMPSDAAEISGCKSERVVEKCKVQFSLGIMIAVICCNLVKACCMVMAVVRFREPTLVTLGDAIDSFLRIPDRTTTGICFADRQFIKKVWRYGLQARPRLWRQEGVQRWWRSVSKTRWITCNFFCIIAITIAGVLLGYGMFHDRQYSTILTRWQKRWASGFGNANSVSLVTMPVGNITQAIFLANLPQTILSFLYLSYNSLFTCMLAGHEWSLFGHHYRTLRVTSPRPGQRSTYWLQIPYTYGIPLMTLSGLLHWLTSQSIFLARVDIWEPFGREVSRTISTVGYSCIATIFALSLGVLALMTAIGMGYKPFAAEITTVGSCSAAISAACHASEADLEGIVGKKVRWGGVGCVPSIRVKHLTFSSEEGVRKPEFDWAYAGVRREKG